MCDVQYLKKIIISLLLIIDNNSYKAANHEFSFSVLHLECFISSRAKEKELKTICTTQPVSIFFNRKFLAGNENQTSTAARITPHE